MCLMGISPIEAWKVSQNPRRLVRPENHLARDFLIMKIQPQQYDRSKRKACHLNNNFIINRFH